MTEVEIRLECLKIAAHNNVHATLEAARLYESFVKGDSQPASTPDPQPLTTSEITPPKSSGRKENKKAGNASILD